MSKLQVKIDGEWQDLEKVEDLSWERTYAKEPLRTVGKIEGTIDTDIDLAELTKPKCFVANDEIEKDHEAHIDMISDTTFAFIEEAYMNLLYKAKAIHCVGENDRIYYEWNYETLERNVPLPHDDRPCYEKGRVTVIYKIIRSDNKAEIFDRNFKKLTSGEFGNPEKYETMLRYWKAQAEAGYPFAEENVRYFEDMVRKGTEMLKIKDNIPLKELEKFGFEYEDFYDTYEFSVSASVMQVKRDRCLTLEGDIFDEKEGNQYLNVIYSLIKADMVEKVEN